MADPVIWWVRKDLRLGDNPALVAAIAAGGPVIPVFVLDEVFSGYGAAPLWRFGLGISQLAEALEAAGSRLVMRRGKASEALSGLCRETGARVVRWSRAYDPDQVARDKSVKAALESEGVDAKSTPGHLLFEPWSVTTRDGGFYKVYSPFWRAVRDIGVSDTIPRPSSIPAPEDWPESEPLENWKLSEPMNRGADVVTRHTNVGETLALGRLSSFIKHRIADYKDKRDYPGGNNTSNLSENLAWGEISPRACWNAGLRAMEEGKAGAEHFLKELVWREFAYHLVWHTPHIIHKNWREGWESFPWNEDERLADVTAWKQGHTGVRFVDAAMREMYVTGRMHNRSRMIVASYLTKHLMCHWRIGLKWFEDCLIDWDPASNAMGWQWTAGSGPDAAPYFRVFNPVTQLEKFDGDGEYVRSWIAEKSAVPTETALAYFQAIPRQWNMSPEDMYPEAPIVAMDEGRQRALTAYQNRDF